MTATLLLLPLVVLSFTTMMMMMMTLPTATAFAPAVTTEVQLQQLPNSRSSGVGSSSRPTMLLSRRGGGTLLGATSNGGRSSRNNNDGDDDKNRRDALALNKARTDIRNFLTQRAIQSFTFLLIHCRDEATVHWLEVSPSARFLFIGLSCSLLLALPDPPVSSCF